MRRVYWIGLSAECTSRVFGPSLWMSFFWVKFTDPTCGLISFIEFTCLVYERVYGLELHESGLQAS